MPIYGKMQILKVTAGAKKCHRINIKGASTPYKKLREIGTRSLAYTATLNVTKIKVLNWVIMDAGYYKYDEVSAFICTFIRLSMH